MKYYIFQENIMNQIFKIHWILSWVTVVVATIQAMPQTCSTWSISSATDKHKIDLSIVSKSYISVQTSEAILPLDRCIAVLSIPFIEDSFIGIITSMG